MTVNFLEQALVLKAWQKNARGREDLEAGSRYSLFLIPHSLFLKTYLSSYQKSFFLYVFRLRLE